MMVKYLAIYFSTFFNVKDFNVCYVNCSPFSNRSLVCCMCLSRVYSIVIYPMYSDLSNIYFNLVLFNLYFSYWSVVQN